MEGRWEGLEEGRTGMHDLQGIEGERGMDGRKRRMVEYIQ